MLQEINRTYEDHLGRVIVGAMPIGNHSDSGNYYIDYEVYFGSPLSFNLSVSVSDGSNVLILNGAEWSDFGIADGDTIECGNFQNSDGSATLNSSFTVVLVNGNELVIDTTMLFTVVFVSGEFYVDKVPQAFRGSFNLIPKDNLSGQNSLIDGTTISLVNDNIAPMSVSSFYPLTQVGNLSGGAFLYSNILRLADSTERTAKRYRINYAFKWWLFLSKFSNYSFDTACVTPYVYSSFLPVFNNPSVALSSGFKPNNDGNSGFRNENFNQNPNHFRVNSCVWTDGINPIGGFDYSRPSAFTIEVETLTANGFGAKCGLVMFNDLQDGGTYEASETSVNGLYNHLRLTLFTENADIVIGAAPVTIIGYLGKSGQQLTLQVEASVVGNILTYSGVFFPNQGFKDYFALQNTTNKNFVLLARTESASFSPSNYSDTVNLEAWKGEAKAYPPVLGNYFESAELRDHIDYLIQTYP